MNLSDEDYLKLCSKGELHLLKELFKNLDRAQIESIRDQYKARWVVFKRLKVILIPDLF